MKRAGIVIVTYNSEAEIGPCLRAAVERCADVVVVDNASQDGTVAEARRWPGVTLIANTSNRGFAAAANQGVAALDCAAVLLLNPDAILRTGIEDLIRECAREETAAAGGKLVDPDGRPQRGFAVRRFPTPLALAFEVLGINRLWPANPVNRRYRCLDLSLEQPADVEQPAGAFLMVRRDVWRQVGGMDEEFHPLWFEDVDLLRRIRNRGYSVRYVPSAVASHTGGHSLRKLRPGWRELYWYGSLLRYASKHFGRCGRAFVCAAVTWGALLRMVVRGLGERSLRPLAAYGKVIRMAGVCLVSGRLAGKTAWLAIAR